MIMMTHFLFIFVGKVVLLRFLSLCVILWCRPAPRVKYVMVHQGRRGGGILRACLGEVMGRAWKFGTVRGGRDGGEGVNENTFVYRASCRMEEKDLRRPFSLDPRSNPHPLPSSLFPLNNSHQPRPQHHHQSFPRLRQGRLFAARPARRLRRPPVLCA